ncbi:MAG: serine/threonine-protein kinase [Phycisphaerales bacterium]|nr:serine/threonine-protein kinase [Phycisphaerales bacterium]
MRDDSKWFTDAGLLLEAVCKTSTHWGQLPDIPGYDELVEIRRGGQGVVYRGRQRSTNRTVAIKVLLDGVYASNVSRQRFQREMQIAARLRDPHIVRIYDSGVTADGRLFYAMEYVQGASIDCAGLKIGNNLTRTLTLFAKICDAVQYAHQRGIIHRDLKPGNILIEGAVASVDDDSSHTDYGLGPRTDVVHPKILDFGLAKVVFDETEGVAALTRVSQTGQFLGSLAFASPEQIEGTSDRIDTRTDVYSLGAILYQLLTGQLPHSVHQNLRQTLNDITTTAPPRPRSIRADLPNDVETMVLRCLAKEPERRYQTAGDLAADIRRFLAGKPIDAKRDQTWYVLRKTLARYKAITALAVVMFVLLVGYAITMPLLYQRAREAERRTLEEVASTQALNNFLVGMLQKSSPELASSREMTVREMLDQAAERLGEKPELPPQVAVGIHRVIAGTYGKLGHLDESESGMRRALEIARTTFGTGDVKAAALMRDLGEILWYRGRFEEAEQLLTEAMAVYEHAADDEALRSEYGLCLFSMAHIHGSRGRPEKAVESYRRAIDLIQGDTVAKRFQRVMARTGLATTLFEQGQFKEAGRQYLETLAEAREKLGDDHAVVATILTHLGRYHTEMEEFDEAESCLSEAMEIYRKRLDPKHARVGTVLARLGNLKSSQGDFESAERFWRDAQAIYVRSFDEDHEKVVGIKLNLAQSREMQKDYAGAAREYRLALESYRRRLGDKDPRTAILRSKLAIPLSELGELEEAEEELRGALAVLNTALSENDPRTAKTLIWLGRVLLKRQNPEEAEPMIRRGIDMLKAGLPAGHSWVALAENALGECLALLGRYEEAETYLLRSWKVIEMRYDSTHEFSRAVFSNICGLYERWGKPDKIAEWCEKSTDP